MIYTSALDGCRFLIETWSEPNPGGDSVSSVVTEVATGERSVWIHKPGPEGLAELCEQLEDAQTRKGTVV